ncbi:MAG TPA: YgeY family selenium metabolism-linked hydrolase [Firmicutes bacterium]|nr:YgeY family selenium metabolism-linked hydrolase [Bacillota bacterium]
MSKDLLKYVEKRYKKDIIKFHRDIVAIPSESCHEKDVIARIRKEMLKVGFDSVRIDKMGNIIGRLGSGKTIIAMDAHIDTVGIGSPDQWKWDPFKGKVENGNIYGRGSVDQKGGMTGMVYAARVIRDFKLTGDYTLYVVGSVQEEDCDGLCWQYLYNEEQIRPEVVVITEPTNTNVYIGHRGRVEIGITVYGKSAHGSAPERGDNAVYKMSRVVSAIERLNTTFKESDDTVLGKGTVAVTHIECKSPSLCAVPDEAYIHLDRRINRSEPKKKVLDQIRKALKPTGVKAKIEILTYDTPSYRNLRYPTEKYYPAWVLDEKHRAVRSALKTSEDLYGKKAKPGKWTFSTNGVATMGMFNIPTLGFGPGNEKYAHAVEEHIPISHLLEAVVWYATFPQNYLKAKGGR